MAVRVRGRDWRVRVGRGSARGKAFTVLAGPRDGASWPAGLGRLELTGGELTEETFTAAWKAAEAELRRAGVRSDLVQLSGYQSYTPAMACELSAAALPRPVSGWEAVRAVVAGRGVGRQSTAAELAATWRIRGRSVGGAVGLLRRLGYEVRDHGTNRRIEPGKFLVPYCFPTLHPKSIQLYKRLAAQG